MPNYRSLVPGGFFSDNSATDKTGKKVPVSVRSNNPGAINGASWEKSIPGYVGDFMYDGKNNTTIFESPEQGTVAWWMLMQKYRAAGAKTLGTIIRKYGGEGQLGIYSEYASTVAKWTGWPETHEVVLTGDDANLLKFYKAMAAMESGFHPPAPLPWSDAQLLYGFSLARGSAAVPSSSVVPAPKSRSLLDVLVDLVGRLFRPRPPAQRISHFGTMQSGDTGPGVEELQNALRGEGSELVVDGEFGPDTEAGVKRFQATANLPVTGIVDSATGLALDLAVSRRIVLQKPAPAAPLPSAKGAAPHLTTARALTGTKELPGEADSAIILAWDDVIAKAFPDMASYAHSYVHDSIPWCGQFVAACLATNGIRPVFGPTDTDKYLWAAAWGKPGPELIQLDPKHLFPGAIMVFTRDGGGHVSFYEGEDDTAYHIRGGNQSDMVNVVRKAKSAFTAATWPKSLPIPANAAPVRMDANHNPVSGSEA